MIVYLREKVVPQLIIIYTRYLIGGAFVFASFIKIKGHRFTAQSGENEPIHSAFHFFETMYQSGLYWRFIGIGQLIAGGLLMTQRFALLGAVANFPILLNVFIITISYDFNATPIITGMMLLANMILLIWDWDKLKPLINQPPKSTAYKTVEHKQLWELIGLILFFFTAFYRIYTDLYSFLFWFITCVVIGMLGLVIAYKQGYFKSIKDVGGL